MEYNIQGQAGLAELHQERGMDSTLLAELEDQEAADFESDPETWKEPHCAPAHYQTPVESFRERFDEVCLFSGAGKHLRNVTEEFPDHSMALWEQMFRDHDPEVSSVVDLEEFREIPVTEQAAVAGNLDKLRKGSSTGWSARDKDPIPGTTQWETLLPPKAEAFLHRIGTAAAGVAVSPQSAASRAE